MIERYGITFQDGLTDADVELRIAFDVNEGQTSLHSAKGFLGAFEHLKRGIDLIWNRYDKPLLIWNDWSEGMLRDMLEHDEYAIWGSSSSWKSTTVAAFATAMWLSNPLRTKGIISSTTLGGLRERIWKDILHFHRSSQCGFGNVIQHPTPKIQTIKGDDSNGIHGVAVEQGDTDKAIDKIKGRHAPWVFVIVDEGTGAQQAIVDAAVNLGTGCEKFKFIMLGNPASYFDQLGRISEPVNGYQSITVEDEGWKTKRGGYCRHLDGHKAPNVLAGKKKYPGMISQDDLDITAKQYGENSARYWQERRGFVPPEGLTKTVLSETMIMKFNAKEKAIWVGDYTIGAGLDPAFEGGDRCVLRFGKCGMIDVETKSDQTLGGIVNPQKSTRSVISLSDRIVIKVDVTSKEPIHYQIARRVKDECNARGVEPRMFALDSTGEGGGLADILAREWSPDILRVEFGGRASDQPVSDTNPRPSYEEYWNRVSELWYFFRVLVQQGQIRDLDSETAQEFCKRYYELRGNLIKVESKTEMKARTGKSPDDSDAVVVLSALFRKRSNDLSKATGSFNRTKRWHEFVMKRNLEVAYAVTE